MEYNGIVNNTVEFTDEFNDWWQTLSESQQEDVAAVVELLVQVYRTRILLELKVPDTTICVNCEYRVVENQFGFSMLSTQGA